MNSIIIRNGIITDPESETHYKADLSVKDDKIAEIAPCILGEAVSEIDASGCHVTPGLIDHHTHIYPLAPIGIPGEAACFSAGVTTAVDAGSTGCDTYEKFVPWLRTSKLDVKCYLNLCGLGLDALPAATEDLSPEHIDENKIGELFKCYGPDLLGLKLRTSRKIVKELGFGPLEAAVKLGEKINVPVMVHITDPPGPLEEIFRRLRPGDIVTHMYQNIGHSILEQGRVSEWANRARERGILFEAADAREHFSFEVGESAIKEKFLPDLLGTDITRYSMHLRPTSFNMAMQISRYVHLGIPFDRVIRLCTWNAAKTMNMEHRIGSLKAGKQADIAVFRPCRQKNVFGDRPYSNPSAKLREGNLVYEPVLTVKNGEMVYRSVTF